MLNNLQSAESDLPRMKKIDATGFKLMLAVMVTVTFAACTNKSLKLEPVPVPAQFAQDAEKPLIKGAPEWVNRGSTVLGKQDVRLIQGVGRADPMGDLAQQKAFADDNARAEVARLLDAFLAELGNGYKSQQSAIEPGKNVDLLQQIRNTSKLDQSATRITGSWRDPKSNTIWSIAELDIRNVKAAITGEAELNGEIKQYVELSADTIFDRLVKGRK